MAHALEHHRAGRLAEAEAIYRAILKARPNDADALYLQGLAAYQQGDPDIAMQHVRNALAQRPDWPEAHYNLGNMLRERGDLEAALASYRAAIALDPGLVDAHYNAAGTLRERGHLDEARAGYERVLSRKPDHAGAHRMLAELKTFSPVDEQIAAMRELLAAATTSEEQRLQLGFALGKALDDLGAYEEAFAHFAEGNRLKRARIRYDVAEDEALTERILQVFDADFMARTRGCGAPSERPILIVGMPRSGTSLVEQILASHPEVYGAGELSDLGRLAGALRAEGDSGARFPEAALALAPGDWARLGETYTGRLAALCPSARFVTDKMPTNLFFLGFLHAMLPNARIIHCLRDPLDTCVSCFTHLFSNGNHFTYDLAELGGYFRLCERLMGRWQELFPECLFALRYESLVAAPEAVTAALLRFCALPWHDGCLAFHETDRPVKTASAVEVRRPIHTGSIGRWRRFQPHLVPLLEVLASGAPAGR